MRPQRSRPRSAACKKSVERTYAAVSTISAITRARSSTPPPKRRSMAESSRSPTTPPSCRPWTPTKASTPPIQQTASSRGHEPAFSSPTAKRSRPGYTSTTETHAPPLKYPTVTTPDPHARRDNVEPTSQAQPASEAREQVRREPGAASPRPSDWIRSHRRSAARAAREQVRREPGAASPRPSDGVRGHRRSAARRQPREHRTGPRYRQHEVRGPSG